MSDIFEQNPTEPGPSQHGNSKRKLIIWGVLGIVTVHLMAVCAYTGLDYLYNILPQESYQHIYEKPWIGMNVRALKFQGPIDFAKADFSLRQQLVSKDNQNNPIPHFLMAELYNSMNQPDKAIAQYKETIRASETGWLNPIRYQTFNDNAHSALAILYYEQGHGFRAQQEIEQIATTDENREADVLTAMKDSLEAPERGDFHLLLGKAFRRELKFKMATQELEKAESLSQSPQLRLEASNFLKSQMPQGIQDLSPMARYYGLAARSAQTNDENLAQAASLFQKALHEDPQFDWGYNELAIIYRELKDYPKATAYANDAITQNTDFYNPYLTLGDIALDQEDYPAAISNFQAAKAILQRLPQEDQQSVVANIENQIAYAYESLHNYGEATRHYECALNLATDAGNDADADFNYAHDGLARIAESKQQNAGKSSSANGKQISWKK